MMQKFEPAKFDLQLFADGTEDTSTEFLANNKLMTAAYRGLIAKAVGSTGTIDKITKMAFGDKGETDEQGNPAPPSNTGDLNNVVATADIEKIEFPSDNLVSFTTTLAAGTAATGINEVALVTEGGVTAAKMRLLTSKGVDVETSLIFTWSIEF